MTRNWFGLIAIGVLIFVFTLAPVFPLAWKPVAQALAGICVIAGIIILVLLAFSGARII